MKAPSHHEKAYHHCVSRIVNRDYVLKEQELISLVHESLGEEQGNKLEWIFNHYHKQGNTNALEALRDNRHDRMSNVSSYMRA